MAEWTNVCTEPELAPGSYNVVDVDDVLIAVFNIDGEYYAIEDNCTHDGDCLTGGDIEGDEIVCPRHGARFCVKTGAVKCAPAYEDIDKVWNEISFMKAAETEVEERNRTYLFEKDEVKKRLVLMKEKLQSMYGYKYPMQRRVMEERLDFLEKERRHIDNIAVVQAQLETYREQGMAATKGDDKERLRALTMMRNESHHPTNVLETHMRAEAVPKPTRHHTAHHILPGSGRWKKVETARARTHIHKHGIRINDPANGVYLVAVDDNTPHWSMPGSGGHKKYHTAEYEGWVAQRISRLTHIDFIKTQLQVIGRILQENEPKDAIANKIKNK